MTEPQVVAFLEALRVKNIRPKGNGWVEGSCPLAQWFHKSHKDSTPSFGLSIAPGDRSWFLCFTCKQGSAEELVAMLEMYTGTSKNYDFARCHQLLSEEQEVVPLPAYGEFHKPQQVFVEWPAYWRESFQPVAFVDAAYAYLTHRGVSPTTMKEFDLRYDSKKHRIVAPYWDVYGRMAGARGRAINDDDKQRHFDYSFQGINNARLVWFNEHVLNYPGPVVVVEGQFDCMRTVQAYPKTVANLTAKPTLMKMRKLGDCGLVIQIPDRDEAGEQSVEVYAKFCVQLGLKHKVIWLDEGVKDAAECHVDYLKDKIAEVVSGSK